MQKLLLMAFLLCGSFASVWGQSTDLPTPELLAKLKTTRDDTARLFLLIRIAGNYVDDSGNDADTALSYVKTVESAAATRTDPRLKGWCHLVRARVFRVRSYYDSGANEALIATTILKPSTVDWAKACMEVGYCYNNSQNPHQDSMRITYFKKAIPVFAAAGEKEWQGTALEFLGYSTAKPQEALPILLQALEIFKTSGHKDFQFIYGALGVTYTTLGDQEQALHYALLNLRASENEPQPSTQTMLANNTVGLCIYNQGDYKGSVPYFQKALDICIQAGDTNDVINIARNVVNASITILDSGTALRAERKALAFFQPKGLRNKIGITDALAHIYFRMGPHDSTRTYVYRMMALDAGLDSNDRTRYITLVLPIFYGNHQKEYSLVKKYAPQLIRIGRLYGNINNVFVGYRELAIMDSALGNYKNAYFEFKQYVRMRDSVRDVNNARQIAALNVKYETERKDRDIQNLTQKQQLSQLALGKASLTRNFTIAGAALLLVLLLVLVNRYRLKQRSNLRLGRLLKEKEWLVKEIHHRVKNNLHMISGLLDSQAGFLKTGEAVSAIRESQHRVNAMSLVHQKLYQTGSLSLTDMSVYIRELVAYLETSFDCSSRIHFNLQVQRLQFGLSHTIPLCLILNEAITNAIKYAFPDGRKGEITIRLQHETGDRFLLSIADDGVGLPAGGINGQADSMGMILMRGLSEDIGGNFFIDGSRGLTIDVVFLYEPTA